MDSVLTSFFSRLALVLIMGASLGCSSTPHAPGKIHLARGEKQQFRILSKDFRLVLSHDSSGTPANNNATERFTIRFGSSSFNNPVTIRFDNEDCDQLISYSVQIQRNSGTTYDYFDNAINLDADIEIQITQEDGKQILLINNHRITLDIKRTHHGLVVDSDGNYILSFNGLKPRNINKEQ